MMARMMMMRIMIILMIANSLVMMAMIKMAENPVLARIRVSQKHGDLAQLISCIRYRGPSPPPRLCLHHPCVAEHLVVLRNVGPSSPC